MQKCLGDLKDVKEQLRVPQVASINARDVTKTAKEEACNFGDEYAAEVGRRWNKVGELTKHLFQLIGSAAAGLKKLAAVHTKLKLHE